MSYIESRSLMKIKPLAKFWRYFTFIFIYTSQLAGIDKMSSVTNKRWNTSECFL